MQKRYTIALIRVILMKLEPSRFSSHCMLIAVLALVAGIAVTVDVAAQQVGVRVTATERPLDAVVMLLPREQTPVQSLNTHGLDVQNFPLGEI